MFGRTPLTRILKTWMAKGGSLSDRLTEKSDLQVNTPDEARLVASAIDHARAVLARSSDDLDAQNDLHAAVALIQSVGTKEARQVLVAQGLPRLRAIVADRLAQPENEGLPAHFALKLLGAFQQPQDVALIAEAARAPLEPDSYMWTMVFYALVHDNPCLPALIAALGDPLPPSGFIRMAFLDSCNGLAIGGHLSPHPFATHEGIAAIEQWLASTNADESSYAVSACAAIPFMPSTERERLLSIARGHATVEVRIEAAWAGVKCGMPGGTEELIAFARDARYSSKVVHYLTELGLQDRIPPEVSTPDFVALAEMCQWLAHPMEFGRPPNTIVQADTRELYWPPARERRQLWVFRFSYDGDEEEKHEGYGLVGSVTWAMAGPSATVQSPEEVYALHCAWELIQNQDPEAPAETQVAAGKAILTKYNPGFGRPVLKVVPS